MLHCLAAGIQQPGTGIVSADRSWQGIPPSLPGSAHQICVVNLQAMMQYCHWQTEAIGVWDHLVPYVVLKPSAVE
jgi:hypothetical protein